MVYICGLRPIIQYNADGPRCYTAGYCMSVTMVRVGPLGLGVGVFRTYFYNHAHLPRLKKTFSLYLYFPKPSRINIRSPNAI